MPDAPDRPGDNVEREPRICPIVETALQEAGLEHATPEERAAMAAYVERCKTNAAWQIIDLCLTSHLGPELFGQAVIRLHTGEPMPEAWLWVEPELRDLIEQAILGTG